MTDLERLMRIVAATTETILPEMGELDCGCLVIGVTRGGEIYLGTNLPEKLAPEVLREVADSIEQGTVIHALGGTRLLS